MDLGHGHRAFDRSCASSGADGDSAHPQITAQLIRELLKSAEAPRDEFLVSLLQASASAIEEGERKFESLLSSVSGTFFRSGLTAPWRAEFLSPGIEAITGYKAEYFELNPYIALVEPEDLALVESAVDRGIAEHQPYSHCNRIRHRSGETRWVSVNGRAIYDADGRPLFLEGFIADVTEKKLLEIEAERSRARNEELNSRLVNILESTLDNVVSLDGDWNLVFANRKAAGRRNATLTGLVDQGEGRLTVLKQSPFWPALQRAKREQRGVYREEFIPFLGAWYQLHAVPDQDGLTIFYRNISDRKALEQALHDKADDLKRTLDALPDIVWSATFGDQGEFLVNKAFYDFVGFLEPREYSFKDILQKLKKSDLVHSEDLGDLVRNLQRIKDAGEGFEQEFRLLHKSGGYRWLLLRAWPEIGDDGEILRWYGLCTDIHDRVTAEHELRESHAIRDNLLNATTDFVSVMDGKGRLILMNDTILRAIGVEDPASVIGLQWLEFWQGESRKSARKALRSAMSGKNARFSAPASNGRDDEAWWDVVLSPIRDVHGNLIGILSSARDVTEQRTAAELLKIASEEDFLTSLPNRRAFERHLGEVTKKRRLSGASVGLMLLDLDHFKHVNDTLGHMAGDHLLRVVSERLRACIGDTGFVARLGGDEFAILLTGIQEEKELVGAATQILSQLASPVTYSGQAINGGLSIGCAMYPRDASDAQGLLKQADTALYDLKSSGRGGIQMFSSDMREAAERTAKQLNLARHAIREDAVEPYYQPKVCLDTGALAGFEALLRWWSPGQGIQPPSSVAEAFNNYELATKIGGLMQCRILEDMRRWQDAGLKVPPVSLNAAPAEFLRGDYAERLLEKLERSGISPSLIEVEITEHLFHGRRSEHILRALELLHRSGVKIALDDFGTGHSSLSHLRDYPVDVVKIDKTFVDQMLTRPAMMAIVEAVAKLGPSLSLDIVAEGIETPEQRDALRGVGCRFGQGYLFGKAMRSAQVAKRIASDAAS